MGVLACVRLDCENIMCDTYVIGLGYVCYGCQKDFKEYLKMNALTPETHSEITRELGIFLEENYKHNQEYETEDRVDEFFKSYTD